MLSRASILSGQQVRALLALSARATATTPAASTASAVDKPGESQVSNRPVRLEPGKVRLGFIPEEWFQFFYKKTGVTGPYTFGITLTTYLLSKEIWVIEHEFYTGLSLLVLCTLAVKKLGPPIAKYLDKEIDDYEAAWNSGRVQQKNTLEEQIEDEKKMQWSADGQLLLMEAKRANVALQLEAAYRARLATVYNAVKQRLDYQVAKEQAERRIQQKNLVEYVVKRVIASITPDHEKANMNKCISELAVLAKSAR